MIPDHLRRSVARTPLAPSLRIVMGIYARILAAWHGEIPKIVRAKEGFLFTARLRNCIDWNVAFYGVWEPDTAKWLPRIIRPGDVVWDVGANIGYFTVLFSHLTGRNGRVLAFEPMEEAFWRMKSLHALNTPGYCFDNVDFFPMALGQEVGQLEAAFEFDFAMRSSGSAVSRRVAVNTIDAISREGAGPLARCDVLKIDVDGYDFRVLRGGEKTIRNLRPRLILEFSERSLVAQGDTMRDLYEFLQSAHYRLFHDATATEFKVWDDVRRLVPEGSSFSINVIGIPEEQEFPAS